MISDGVLDVLCRIATRGTRAVGSEEAVNRKEYADICAMYVQRVLEGHYHA